MTEGLDRRDALAAGMLTLALTATKPSVAEAQTSQSASGNLEARAALAEDHLAVENLMDSFPSFQHAGLYQDVLSMFALNQPDVRVEIRGIGKWEGSAAVQKAIILIPERVDQDFAAARTKQFPNVRLEPRAGRQFEMPLASGVIHVARDGRTAKGLWTAWGPQTGVGRDGKIAALWVAEKYAVDFIKEGDAWKFWHFQIAPEFTTPYETSWVDTMRNPGPLPAHYRGSLAPTSSSTAPAHSYDPRPPEPYQTFARTWSY